MVMYAPHTLFIGREKEVRDEFNRTVSKELLWDYVGRCRCDDNTTVKIVDDAGQAYVPKYHIVAARAECKAGDRVRVMDGERLRAEGEIIRVVKTNYLDYMSLYV